MLQSVIIASLVIFFFFSSSSFVYSTSARRVMLIKDPDVDIFEPIRKISTSIKADMWLKPQSLVQPTQTIDDEEDVKPVQNPTPDIFPSMVKSEDVSNIIQSLKKKLSKRDEYLSTHNKIRALFSEKPLKWDAKLAKFSQNLVKSLNDNCTMVHTPDSPYGENLLWTLKGPWTPSAVVGKWVDEQKYFDPKNNVCIGGNDCGHYTQVVWATTERVGCGRGRCKNGKGFIYACAYDPPGNYYNEGPFGGNYTNSIVPPPS